MQTAFLTISGGIEVFAQIRFLLEVTFGYGPLSENQIPSTS